MQDPEAAIHGEMGAEAQQIAIKTALSGKWGKEAKTQAEELVKMQEEHAAIVSAMMTDSRGGIHG